MNDSKDSIQLKRLVTEKRRNGQLPWLSPSRAWAGSGSGALCMLCEVPIDSAQIEYEVEWKDGLDIQLLRFHELCYRLCSEPG